MLLGLLWLSVVGLAVGVHFTAWLWIPTLTDKPWRILLRLLLYPLPWVAFGALIFLVWMAHKESALPGDGIVFAVSLPIGALLAIAALPRFGFYRRFVDPTHPLHRKRIRRLMFATGGAGLAHVLMLWLCVYDYHARIEAQMTAYSAYRASLPALPAGQNAETPLLQLQQTIQNADSGSTPTYWNSPNILDQVLGGHAGESPLLAPMLGTQYVESDQIFCAGYAPDYLRLNQLHLTQIQAIATCTELRTQVVEAPWDLQQLASKGNYLDPSFVSTTVELPLLQSMVKADQGRLEAAITDLNGAARLTDFFARDPHRVRYFYWYSSDETYMRSLEWFLARPGLTGDSLKTLVPPQSLSESDLSVFRHYGWVEPAVRQQSMWDSRYPVEYNRPYYLTHWLKAQGYIGDWGQVLRGNAAAGCDEQAQPHLAAALKTPYWEQPELWRAFSGKLWFGCGNGARYQDTDSAEVHAILMVYLTVAQANRQVISAAVAVERFHRVQGVYPITWDELVPAYLPAAPIDPCSGQPLKLAGDATGVLVYSVGPDGIDDQGLNNFGQNIRRAPYAGFDLSIALGSAFTSAVQRYRSAWSSVRDGSAFGKTPAELAAAISAAGPPPKIGE